MKGKAPLVVAQDGKDTCGFSDTSSPAPSASFIHVVYCGDDSMFDGVLSSAISLLNRTTKPIAFHVLTMTVSGFDALHQFSDHKGAFLDTLVSEKYPGSSFTIHDLSEDFERELAQSPNLDSFYTPYSLLRLFLDFVLPHIDKLIYLDVDVMAAGNINELFTQHIDGYEYAGVLDRYGSKLLHRDYINSGVLLFNMNKCRETGLFERARHIVATEKLMFPDQDALYRATTSKRFLPRRFNEQKRFDCAENILCHFTRRLYVTPWPHRENWKQWHIDKLHNRLKCFTFDDDLAEYQQCKAEFDLLNIQGDKVQYIKKDTTHAIVLSHVYKTYQTGSIKTHALDNVSLEISPGTMTVILGSSGSGKSTLLNIIGGLDVPSSGSVAVNNTRVDKLSKGQRSLFRRNRIGFVFQSYNLIQDLTALENVELSAGMTECCMTSEEAIRAVGLYDKRTNYPSQLSGGEQQRVSIARALVKKSGILLCDEPTGALDFETGLHVLNIIDNLRRQYNRTTIIVTHNSAIARIADFVITMHSGCVIDIQREEHPLSINEALR